MVRRGPRGGRGGVRGRDARAGQPHRCWATPSARVQPQMRPSGSSLIQDVLARTPLSRAGHCSACRLVFAGWKACAVGPERDLHCTVTFIVVLDHGSELGSGHGTGRLLPGRVWHGYLDTGGYSTEPCILKYMDTGYSCIADTTVLQYLHPHGIHDTGYCIAIPRYCDHPGSAAASGRFVKSGRGLNVQPR